MTRKQFIEKHCPKGFPQAPVWIEDFYKLLEAENKKTLAAADEIIFNTIHKLKNDKTQDLQQQN